MFSMTRFQFDVQRYPGEPGCYLMKGEAVEFLSHPQDDLVECMKAQMLACAERLEFERAQRIRDQTQALEITLERQIVERAVDHDQDVIYVGERNALVAQIRRGVLQGMALHELKDSNLGTASSAHFLLAHYATQSPSELIVNQVDDPQAVARALTIANRTPVRITIPQTGYAYELLKLCERNYDYRVSQRECQ
jgi:excinuclease ABC subunit C